MATYPLILRGSHYTVLLKNARPGSEIDAALRKASPPTLSNHHGLTCSAKAVKELLVVAEQFCPDALLDISKQLRTEFDHEE